MSIFEKADTALLIKALVSLQTEDEAKLLLEDLLTAKEIDDLSQRLRVAQLLLHKENYATVSKETGASSATISRVNRCVVYGGGGYESVLKKLGD